MKDIVGYEGLYAITSCGKVWSYRRKKFLQAYTTPRGYMSVCLSKDGVKKNCRVHRLVAQAYIPNPLGLPEVNHIDEDKTNNNMNNLEWITCQDNIIYSGANKRCRKRTKIRCVETGQIYKDCVAAGNAHGVSPYVINCAVNGKQKTSAGYNWERAE